MRTEGYQVGDLVSIVDRAIGTAHIRKVCPNALRDTIGSPAPKRRSRVSFTFDDAEILASGSGSSVGRGGGGGVNSPLTSRSLPSSPLKERRRLKITKSLSPTLVQRSLASTTQENIDISTLTLVNRTHSQLLEVDSDGKMRLNLRDFNMALQGYIPVTLRGLSLHSRGTVDFSGVGGMKDTKKILRETILWPSLVNI